MLSERRLHPRVATDLPGELELAGTTFDVRLVNLSLAGFLVEGGAELTQLQLPYAQGVPEVDLHFGLEQGAIHCRCRVVYKRRHSHSEAALGLHILALSAAAEQSIVAFVDASLARG